MKRKIFILLAAISLMLLCGSLIAWGFSYRDGFQIMAAGRTQSGWREMRWFLYRGRTALVYTRFQFSPQVPDELVPRGWHVTRLLDDPEIERGSIPTVLGFGFGNENSNVLNTGHYSAWGCLFPCWALVLLTVIVPLWNVAV